MLPARANAVSWLPASPPVPAGPGRFPGCRRAAEHGHHPAAASPALHPGVRCLPLWPDAGHGEWGSSHRDLGSWDLCTSSGIAGKNKTHLWAGDPWASPVRGAVSPAKSCLLFPLVRPEPPRLLPRGSTRGSPGEISTAAPATSLASSPRPSSSLGWQTQRSRACALGQGRAWLSLVPVCSPLRAQALRAPTEPLAPLCPAWCRSPPRAAPLPSCPSLVLLATGLLPLGYAWGQGPGGAQHLGGSSAPRAALLWGRQASPRRARGGMGAGAFGALG